MCDFRKESDIKTVVINGIEYDRTTGAFPFICNIDCFNNKGAENTAKVQEDGKDGLYFFCASGSGYGILFSGEWYWQTGYHHDGWESNVWKKWSQYGTE